MRGRSTSFGPGRTSRHGGLRRRSSVARDESRAFSPVPAVTDWTQPLHPLIVHFPLGLLVSAAAIDVASLATRPLSAVRHVATGLYVAGAVSLVAAYFSGRADADALRVPGMAHAIIDAHWTWALRTTLYFGVLSLVRAALAVSGYVAPRRVWIPVVAGGVLGLALLFQTAERGGRLVYEHGVGVAAPR